MERLIEKLLTIVRLVLSGIGLSVGATPSRNGRTIESVPAKAASPDQVLDHRPLPVPESSQEHNSAVAVSAQDASAELTDEAIPCWSANPVTAREAPSISTELASGSSDEGQTLSSPEILVHKPVVETDLEKLTIAGLACEVSQEFTESDEGEEPVAPQPASDSHASISVTNFIAASVDKSDRDTPVRIPGAPSGASKDRVADSQEPESAYNQEPLPTPVGLNKGETTRCLDGDSDQTSPSPLHSHEPLDDESFASSQYVTVATNKGVDDAPTSDSESCAGGDKAEGQLASGKSYEVLQHTSHSQRNDTSSLGAGATESSVRTDADSVFEGSDRLRLPRRPVPAEDAGEYTIAVHDISTVDREYAHWNAAVVEKLLLAKSATEEVYLCTTPRILASAFAEAGFDALTPEEAERRFTTAVANVYRERVLKQSERLRILRRSGDDGLPDCAAFLAASVLAAYRMQSDEEASANAYYRRLGDLLGCEMSGPHPVGFSTTVFESLWVFVRKWLDETHGQRLAMPGSWRPRFLTHFQVESIASVTKPSFSSTRSGTGMRQIMLQKWQRLLQMHRARD